MFLLRTLLFLLRAPWSVTFLLYRGTVRALRLPGALSARSATELSCPAGHANTVLGRWTCHCGATYLGHAFAPCPCCGAPAGWMKCETCGLALNSPWKNDP